MSVELNRGREYTGVLLERRKNAGILVSSKTNLVSSNYIAK
jgi:hypothetical protein